MTSKEIRVEDRVEESVIDIPIHLDKAIFENKFSSDSTKTFSEPLRKLADLKNPRSYRQD